MSIIFVLDIVAGATLIGMALALLAVITEGLAAADAAQNIWDEWGRC